MTLPHDRFGELVNRARDAARARYPSLTEGQVEAVSRQIAHSREFSIFRDEGWSRPSDEEFGWQLDAIAREQPVLLEKVPSATDLTATLLAQPGAPSDAVGRLTLAREVAAMTDDERLEKVRLLQQVSPNGKQSPSAPSRTTDDRSAPREKPACEMTQTELNALIEQRMGRPTSQMLASQGPHVFADPHRGFAPYVSVSHCGVQGETCDRKDVARL